MNLSQRFEHGDVGALAAHLKERPEDVRRATPMAARGERLDLLQCVLSHDPAQWDLDVALECAAGRPGGAVFVRTLLDAGASPAGTTPGPLWAAAGAGDAESLRSLLAAGADPDVRSDAPHGDPDGCRIPLLAAIRSGVPAAVAALLEAGADVNVVTPALNRPLDVAQELGDAAIIQALRERGARVLAPEEVDLRQAAKRGFTARVRAVLPAATPELRGGALVSAVQAGQAAAAEAILEHGGVEAGGLVLALAQCIAFDVPEVVPALIAAGVDRESTDHHYHAPPIVLAADRGRVSIVRDLLDAGVDLQVRDQDGRNALAAARENGHTEVVRVLRAAGASARTPAAIARAARQKLAADARNSWTPQLDGETTAGDPSRFGGMPHLRPGEAWPACTDCEAPLTFFVQVALSRVPKAARQTLGAGLLQLFHCTACNGSSSGSHQVRIIAPDDLAGLAAVPAAPVGTRVLPQRPVTGWARAVKDHPYREADESALLPEERAIVFTLNRQGDKLGGWPNWVQDAEYPACPDGGHRMTGLVLQIDSDHGAAHTWGDNGVAFIVQCPLHRDRVAFVWQSA